MLLHTFRAAEYNPDRNVLLSNLLDNDAVMKQLSLERKLKVHQGCVNSLTWNESGEYLLSGSDDLKLVISNPFNGRVAARIPSGHKRNIFQAKFLSQCGNRKVISCAVDGSISYTQVDQPDCYGKCLFNCHKKTVYQVLPTPHDPNLFLSCSDDGSLRCYDLREQTSCVDEGCSKFGLESFSQTLFSHKIYSAETDILLQFGSGVTALDVNPYNPFYMVSGTNDSVVSLFDRRMLHRHSKNDVVSSTIKYYDIPKQSKSRKRITYLQFNRLGNRVLVNAAPDRVIELDLERDDIELNPDFQDEANKSSQSDTDGQQPRMKVRVRGDWSGTGPDSQPGGQQSSSTMSRTERLFMEMSSALTNILQNRARLSTEQESQQSESEEESDDESEHQQTDQQMSDSVNYDNPHVVKVQKNINKEVPKMSVAHYYKGHRNQRTMIKQCSYWGDNIIVAGSDCGHLFIWRRDNEKLLTVIPADKRVVNSVKPHPYYPLLATSGIDYDIKIWTPQLGADEQDMLQKDKIKDEVADKNEKMIQESDDIVTLPARFVLPLMALMARRQAAGET